jgi:hypothetical protein
MTLVRILRVYARAQADAEVDLRAAFNWMRRMLEGVPGGRITTSADEHGLAAEFRMSNTSDDSLFALGVTHRLEHIELGDTMYARYQGVLTHQTRLRAFEKKLEKLIRQRAHVSADAPLVRVVTNLLTSADPL